MVEFRVLGPVEAVVDGRLVPLPAAKPRALLALLLLSRNRVVPVGELIDELWGERPPDTATKALQGYVSQLRKALGADRLLTKPPGYCLQVEPGELDLDRFDDLARQGRELLARGDAGGASERLAEALALCRGRSFAEFDGEPFARDAGARQEEARLAALEDRIEADLAVGRHAELVPELEDLVRREPLRERLRGQLMLALYRSGRQAEALEVYRQTREELVEQLGIDPGPELQELERAILVHDEGLTAAKRIRPVIAGPETTAEGPRHRRLLVAGAAVVVLAGAGGATAFALTRGGSSTGTDSAARAAFVVKIENLLAQSREGRGEATVTIDHARRCSLGRGEALARLSRVQRNRQSLLQQAAALSVPPGDDALRASDLLQQAIQASIAADWHYRDWLIGRRGCAAPGGRDYEAALSADVEASRSKERFAAAFNPLARGFGKRTWSADEF